MVKGMKRRDLVRALIAAGCTSIRNDGDHEVYGCPCGSHIYPVPRHREISSGVVRKAPASLPCLPKGWI